MDKKLYKKSKIILYVVAFAAIFAMCLYMGIIGEEKITEKYSELSIYSGTVVLIASIARATLHFIYLFSIKNKMGHDILEIVKHTIATLISIIGTIFITPALSNEYFFIAISGISYYIATYILGYVFIYCFICFPFSWICMFISSFYEPLENCFCPKCSNHISMRKGARIPLAEYDSFVESLPESMRKINGEEEFTIDNIYEYKCFMCGHRKAAFYPVRSTTY